MIREISSIQKHIYSILSTVTIYRDVVPVEAVTPSIYYLVPVERDRIDTKDGYEVTVIQRAKILDSSSMAAYDKANQIAELIRKNKYALPLVNSDGSFSTDLLYFDSVEVQEGQDFEANLTITFSVKYKFI